MVAFTLPAFQNGVTRNINTWMHPAPVAATAAASGGREVARNTSSSSSPSRGLWRRTTYEVPGNRGTRINIYLGLLRVPGTRYMIKYGQQYRYNSRQENELGNRSSRNVCELPLAHLVSCPARENMRRRQGHTWRLMHRVATDSVHSGTCSARSFKVGMLSFPQTTCEYVGKTP